MFVMCSSKYSNGTTATGFIEFERFGLVPTSLFDLGFVSIGLDMHQVYIYDFLKKQLYIAYFASGYTPPRHCLGKSKTD